MVKRPYQACLDGGFCLLGHGFGVGWQLRSESSLSPAEAVLQKGVEKGALGIMGLVIMTWGLSWVVMKQVGQYIGPLDMVAVRYVLAFLFLWGVQRVKKQRLHPTPWLLTLGVALFQTVGFQVFAQFALMYGGAGHTSALAYTMPFWILLFSWWLLGERPGPRHWWGMFAALIGLVLIMAPWEGLGAIQGSLLAVSAGISWAFGSTCSRMMFQRYKVNLLNATVWQCFLGMVITLPLSLLVQQQSIIIVPELIFGLFYLGVLATGAGWLMWMEVLRRVRASVAGISSLGVPALTVFLAWLFIGEVPTGPELAGIFFVMLGLLVVNWPARRP